MLLQLYRLPLSLLLSFQWRMASLTHSLVHTHSVSHCSTPCYYLAQFHTLKCTLSISHPPSLSVRLYFLFSLLRMSPPPHSFSVNYFLSFFPPLWNASLCCLLPLCLSTTCQFLGGGGLFGDRWRSAFHLNGDPGGEAGLGGREQLLIGQGVSSCHYAPSTTLLLDQCHSVSQSVARWHGPGRRNRLVVMTVRHFWGWAREDLDLSASLSVALRPRRSCPDSCFSVACTLVAVNFVSYH